MSDRAPIERVDLPALRLVCLRSVGPYGPRLRRFWAEDVGRWLAQHGRHGRTTYGISLDDPAVTPGEHCRYDAGVELAPGEPAGPGEHVVCLPAGRYAVQAFEGPVAQLGDAWHRLLTYALADVALQLDGRPCFERYAAADGFDAATGTLRCGLFVPVAPA